MKKRLFMIACVLCLSMFATACKEKTEETETEETTSDSTEELPEDAVASDLLNEIDVQKCVTLGEYKGITIEKTVIEVTDEDINNLIQTDLDAYPVEVTGRTAQNGDTVDIDYVGRMDGEEFDGGSDQGAMLTLGSGQFIDGFESGLVGASAGETRVLNLTFPDEYTEELAGKEVEFTVTVNAIKAPLEEPTDEWVAENIEGYYTVDEYKEGLRTETEATNQETAEEQVRYSAWTQVIDGCTVETYPDTLVEYYTNYYIEQSEAYASYYGMELADFIESSGMTQEQFDTSAAEYGKEIAAQAMICRAICEEEGYAIGDETYQAELQTILDEYGCTEEELIESYGRDNVEQTVLLNLVCTVILDNAIITEVTE